MLKPEGERRPTNSTSTALNPNPPSLNFVVMAKKPPASPISAAPGAINHPSTFLGTPWTPKPDPNAGASLPGLTEYSDELCGSDSPRAEGLGFSRYV